MGTNIKKTHYISSPDGMNAMMIEDQTGSQLYYVATDYLGSICGLMDANGNMVEEYSYDGCSVKSGFWKQSATEIVIEPITLWREGNRRNPNDWAQADLRVSFISNRGYTGHEHLNQFSLINMLSEAKSSNEVPAGNGRAYDPIVGQILSPDPFVQNSEFSQSYNRYSYCWNNPLKYVDPSGYYTIYIDGMQFQASSLGYWKGFFGSENIEELYGRDYNGEPMMFREFTTSRIIYSRSSIPKWESRSGGNPFRVVTKRFLVPYYSPPEDKPYTEPSQHAQVLLNRKIVETFYYTAKTEAERAYRIRYEQPDFNAVSEEPLLLDYPASTFTYNVIAYDYENKGRNTWGWELTFPLGNDYFTGEVRFANKPSADLMRVDNIIFTTTEESSGAFGPKGYQVKFRRANDSYSDSFIQIYFNSSAAVQTIGAEYMRLKISMYLQYVLDNQGQEEYNIQKAWIDATGRFPY
ncbi:MAG: hypothetical protein JXR53_11360 [Bacteroidales bacterium]|nr:hypothetical protein [Bacteroidales bacterium]